MLFAVGCSETPEDPQANRPPVTFISTYSIEIAPDSATFYGVTVYWRGADLDGQPTNYRYWIDGMPDTTETLDTSVRFSLEFSDATPTYTFNVVCQDNMNVWDATAATVVISMDDVRHGDEFNPQVIAVSVPANGAATSQAVLFAVSASDVDGIITELQYAVDDPTSWTSVVPGTPANNVSAAILLGPSDLALGPHIIYFRAEDNMGNVDESPLTVSIVCYNTFAPELAVSVTEGQSFLVPFTAPLIFDLQFNYAPTVDFYYGIIDSIVVNTSWGISFNSAIDSVMAIDDDTGDTTWVKFDTGFNIATFDDTLSSGNYWFEVTAYDASANFTNTGQINFAILELAADNGILCVNGVDWGTYGQAAVMWNDGVPWGNRTNFKTWDLFDTSPIYEGSDFGDSLLGKGGGVPAWMIDTVFFEAISWFGNEYSGDFQYWEAAEEDLMAYLAMGGNILLPVRYGVDWFFDDLATYCGILPDDWVLSADADFLTAKVGTLADITVETAQSLWDIPMTDNPDNLWIYEAATAAPALHAGFITLPNGNGGGGAFCYIAGRSYRWDNPSLKAAVDVVLNTYFGVP